MEVIRVEHLTKHFGRTTAVNNVSISVEAGEIYGFLGLNGAGKTSLIRALLRIIKPDDGTISLFGKAVSPRFDCWNDVGYLVETPYAYPNLSVYENLRVCYLLRKQQEPAIVDRILELLNLTAFRDTRAKSLSMGNRQRLGLAKALLHSPRLIILDEPINGLDPEGIVEVRHLLKSLAARGSTVFVSSHILGEISKIATRIGIIHNGQMLKEMDTAALAGQLQQHLSVDTRDNPEAMRHLRDAHYAVEADATGTLKLSGEGPLTQPENVTQLLVEKGVPPTKVFPVVEDLEMFFLRTINHHE